MLYFSLVGLASLLAINLSLGRSLLFPPALFSAMWLLNLFVLWVIGDLFFRVSDTACLVYLLGAVSFAVGGLIILHTGRVHKRSIDASAMAPTDRKWVHSSLDLVLLILVAAFPIYLQIARQVAGNVSLGIMLTVIRANEVDAEAGADPFGFAANLTVLALLCAPAIIYESDGSWRWRLRSIIAVILVLAYGILTGSKQNALIVFVLFFVSWIRSGRLRLRILALSTAVVVTLFSVGIFFVNLASNAEAVGGAGGAVRRVANTVLAYWLGGVVAFSRVAEEPDSIKVTQNIWRFFLELGRNLGFDVVVPTLHLPYTTISGDPSIKFLGINVYTIYFSYFPDFGWAGVIIGMMFVGAITTAVWKRATGGSAPFSLIYASLCLGIVLSFFADYFWLNLNFYIKASLFYATLYVLIPKMARTTKAIYSWNAT